MLSGWTSTYDGPCNVERNILEKYYILERIALIRADDRCACIIKNPTTRLAVLLLLSTFNIFKRTLNDLVLEPSLRVTLHMNAKIQEKEAPVL